MSVKLEKILNIDLKSYVESKGINLGAYDLVGIHYAGDSPYESISLLSERFVSLVPDRAEVVVNYRIMLSGDRSYQCGVALIPK